MAKKYLILIADDKDENRLLLRKIIASAGYDVQEAANGKEGLKIARLHKPDIIISDVLMPVMDGFQFCKEVKQDEKLKNIPFVFYTATYTDKKDEEFALSLGAEKYVVKPVAPEEILNLIQQIIEKYKKGDFSTPKKVIEGEEEVFKRYSERLVNKLEKKTFDLQKEIIERKRAYELLHKSSEYLKKFSEASFRLMSNKTLFSGNLNAALQEITETTADTMETDRVSVWFFNDDHSKICCEDLFERESRRHSKGAELLAKDYTNYFKAMVKERIISADDAHNDPRTKEFSHAYLTPLGITSMLDAGIRSEGKLIGVICIEHIGPKLEWMFVCQSFAGSIADLISLAIEAKEHKDAETALRESEAKFKQLIEELPDAIFVTRMGNGMSGEILDVNPAAEDQTGYTRAELIGMNIISDLGLAEGLSLIAQRDNELQTGKKILFTEKKRHKDGTEYWTEVLITAFMHNDEKASLSVHRDITKQKIAEEAIIENREQIRLLLDSTAEGIYGLDKNDNCTMCNQAALSMLGYSDVQELVGKNMHNLIHHTHVDGAAYTNEECNIRKSFLSGESFHVDDEVFWRSDGSSFPAEYWSYPILRDGMIIGAVVTFMDITERKQAEYSLQVSEKRFRTIMEQAGDAMYLSDFDGNILDINNHACKNLGYSRDEFLSMKVGDLDCIYLDLELQRKLWETFIPGKPQIFETKHKRKDGTVFPVEINAGVIEMEGKKLILGFVRDITERKRAEDQIRKLSQAVEQNPATIVITDLLGNIEYVNPKFTQISGYTFSEAKGQNPRVLKSDEKPSEEYKELWDTITRGDVWRGEFHNKKKNGELYWEEASIGPIKNEQGEITHFLAIKEDITQRKRAEEAIKESEARLKKAQAIAHLGHWELDLIKNELKWSDEIYRIFGLTPQEFGATYEDFLNYIHPDDREFVNKSFTDSVNNKTPYNIVHRIVRPDGETRYVHELAEEIVDETGKTIRSLGIVQDITVNKLAEQELKNSEERLKILFKYAPDTYFLSDLKGITKDVNKEGEKLLGLKKKDILNKNFLDLKMLPPTQIPKAAAMMAKSALMKKIKPLELEINRTDGSKVDVELRIHPVKIQNKMHILGMARDITHRIKTEKELKKHRVHLEELVKDRTAELEKSQNELQIAKETAESATRSKSEFLANMSHEIRTPMNAILGINYLLQKSGLTTEQQNYITNQENSAKNLLGIINDILDFSKIEAGKLTIESIEFDFNEVLTNLSNMIRIKARSKKLELIFNIDPDIPVNLYGDPLRLSQILLNLSSNAIKFTEHGEVILTAILIKQTTTDVHIKFCVSDTGIGMTKQQQKNLFRPFTQADASTSRKYGGTGLGLSISKRLVELMGGEIVVTSKYKQGSTFYFTMSFKKVVKKIKEKEIIPEAISNLKVLIVDDNIHVQELYTKTLQMFKIASNGVGDGEKAIKELERIKQSGQKGYDLIVLDWVMPGMNGEETIREIVNKNLFDLDRIIINSGFIDEFELENAANLGIKHILQKPVSPSMLYDCIMNIISPDKKIKIIGKTITEEYQQIAGRMILLVEDQEVNQQVAKDLLESEGLKVDTADNGAIAVEMVRKTNFDAVLMDLQMPVMDGYKATREIRKFKQSTELPIIAMTADAIVGVKEECLKSGMDDFVTKPIEPKTLFSTLTKWIKSERKTPKGQAKKRILKKEVKRDNEYPEITYLNTKNGIERLNGNVESYIKIVLKFRKNNLDTLDKIKNNIKKNRIEEAGKLVHATKGVSGNISADKLFEVSTELDDVLRNNRINKIKSVMNDFEKELNNVLNSIDKFEKQLEMQQKKKPVDIPADIDIDQELEELKPILKELEKSLKENNMKSKELLTTLKDKARSALMLELIQKICDSLDNYNFDEGYKQFIDFKKKYKL